MKKMVSLREIVATKIVYAVILVSYYWMWARTDWKDWYVTVQQVLGWFFVAFFILQMMRIRRYKKEGVDELAERNLKRCDSVCLKIFVGVMAVAAFVCAILGHIDAAYMGALGWVIVLSILGLTVVRTAMFIVLDSKGM